VAYSSGKVSERISVKAERLNAIIPNLSTSSYSWKKYPAFLTSEDYRIFSA
jgi:hypothetical protein